MLQALLVSSSALASRLTLTTTRQSRPNPRPLRLPRALLCPPRVLLRPRVPSKGLAHARVHHRLVLPVLLRAPNDADVPLAACGEELLAREAELAVLVCCDGRRVNVVRWLQLRASRGAYVREDEVGEGVERLWRAAQAVRRGAEVEVWDGDVLDVLELVPRRGGPLAGGVEEDAGGRGEDRVRHEGQLLEVKLEHVELRKEGRRDLGHELRVAPHFGDAGEDERLQRGKEPDCEQIRKQLGVRAHADEAELREVLQTRYIDEVEDEAVKADLAEACGRGRQPSTLGADEENPRHERGQKLSALTDTSRLRLCFSSRSVFENWKWSSSRSGIAARTRTRRSGWLGSRAFCPTTSARVESGLPA